MSAMPYNFLSFFFVGGIIVFWIALAVLFYVFFALGLYTMAKRRGLENPWLAWIPVAYLYTLGKLADTYAAQYMNKKTNYALLLLLLVAAVVVLVIVMLSTLAFGMMASSGAFMIPYIICVVLLVAVSIVYAVFYYIALYRIYNWHTESSVVLLVLSILFNVIVPFVLFALRNGDNRTLYPPQTPPGQPYQQPQPPQGYNQ